MFACVQPASPISRRFVAVFLDGILLWAAIIPLQLLTGWKIIQTPGARPSLFVQLVSFIIQIGGGVAYETILIGKCGATPGKMALKIKVVAADGGRVSYWRAAGRYFARLLSAVTLMIGYVMAAFDTQKRVLHDRICKTRVITK
jgi:uncharacterized RDD family membrane protein YckC